MTVATMSPRHWDRKAEQARAQAKAMNNPEAKALMRDVAKLYKVLARSSTSRPRHTSIASHAIETRPAA